MQLDSGILLKLVNYKFFFNFQCLLLVYNTELKMDQQPTLNVCKGDSVAGYVGWKKETIITSLLHEVKRTCGAAIECNTFISTEK